MVDAIALHFVVVPRAVVLISIGPLHLSESLEIIFDELSIVGPLVSKSVFAASMHEIFHKVTPVRGAILPSFATLTVSHTFLPLAVVLATIFDG